MHTLNQKLAEIWPHFFSCQPAQITYQPGWKNRSTFSDCLAESLTHDILSGYTQCGPHRADIVCKTHEQQPLFTTFSQGQQKLFSYILRFIQLDMVPTKSNHHRILRIVDLSAELDPKNQVKI